ncbi:Detected protein of unknown function [Hibiscus syriacus]|uniref:Sulfotransferase n=1 Tax=Hibiscus syriacus TaxID=106335 RepID=A0A6A2WE59_HIBSY|nr:Detected protein of unknown function [Hibiscus syriacus]
MRSPRLFHTHVPYTALPDSVKTADFKFVYIAKNPKDTLVSMWHFFNKLRKPQQVLEPELEGPRQGAVFKHEDLKRNPITEVKKLASFKGKPFSDDKEVEDVIWQCSLERLKNLEITIHDSEIVELSVIEAMTTKFDIEKFNGRDFSLWKLNMKVILRKDGCLAVISERPIDFKDDNKWIEIDENVMANFHLALADEGYRLWDPTARKVIISMDVIFVEDKLQRKEEDISAKKLETTQIHVEKEFEQGDSSKAEPTHDEQELESSEAPTTQDVEPSTYQEAINNSDASQWMMAMQEEIEALHKNNTWDLVPLPQGRKPIGNKWVFKIKRNGDDQVERYRARLVVKGYAQKEEHRDVKTTFLHGNLEEEIYMLHPEVGSLMFAMICTRSDIAQTMGVVSRYMANPGKEY